jgi:hypothetical protein
MLLHNLSQPLNHDMHSACTLQHDLGRTPLQASMCRHDDFTMSKALRLSIPTRPSPCLYSKRERCRLRQTTAVSNSAYSRPAIHAGVNNTHQAVTNAHATQHPHDLHTMLCSPCFPCLHPSWCHMLGPTPVNIARPALMCLLQHLIRHHPCGKDTLERTAMPKPLRSVSTAGLCIRLLTRLLATSLTHHSMTQKVACILLSCTLHQVPFTHSLHMACGPAFQWPQARLRSAYLQPDRYEHDHCSVDGCMTKNLMRQHVVQHQQNSNQATWSDAGVTLGPGMRVVALQISSMQVFMTKVHCRAAADRPGQQNSGEITAQVGSG